MHFSNEEKTMWIEDWEQSGKSAWAYAKGNGLNPQTFSKWVKSGREAKSCFVEVPAHVWCLAPPLEYGELCMDSLNFCADLLFGLSISPFKFLLDILPCMMYYTLQGKERWYLNGIQKKSRIIYKTMVCPFLLPSLLSTILNDGSASIRPIAI